MTITKVIHADTLDAAITRARIDISEDYGDGDWELVIIKIEFGTTYSQQLRFTFAVTRREIK